MDKLIRVVIVDDHVIVRKGVISIVADNPSIEVVGEGSAGNHVLELLAAHRPDVLIVDLQMPARLGGPKGLLFEPITTLQRAIQEYPETAVLVLSQEHNVQTIQSLAEAGIRGYILKTDDFTTFLDKAIEMVVGGIPYFSHEVMEVIVSSPPLRLKTELTARQLEVLRLIVYTPTISREAQADELAIALSTLQKHIQAIFSILEVPNMESCLIKAMRMGLIDVDRLLEAA